MSTIIESDLENTRLREEIESLRQQLIGMQGRFEKDQDRIRCQAEQLAESESERMEQARLLGMSGEREAWLLADIERLKGECLSFAIEATHGIQLAAAQAREQQLRYALDHYQHVGKQLRENCHGSSRRANRYHRTAIHDRQGWRGDAWAYPQHTTF